MCCLFIPKYGNGSPVYSFGLGGFGLSGVKGDIILKRNSVSI